MVMIVDADRTRCDIIGSSKFVLVTQINKTTHVSKILLPFNKSTPTPSLPTTLASS